MQRRWKRIVHATTTTFIEAKTETEMKMWTSESSKVRNALRSMNGDEV
jgi:hypothetical protein